MTSETAAPPRVAVVVPAYQAAAYVAQTLESVLSQTFDDWTCVVVDDGSTDGTAAAVEAVARRDPRVRLVRQENRGLSGARNRGVEEAPSGATYLAFLDADDLWLPDALARLVALADASPEVVGVYGYAELVDETGAAVEPGAHPERQRDRQRVAGWRVLPVAEMEPVEFDEWVVNGPLWPPAVGLHRRAVVERAGTFDTGLKQLEDWDFYLRMARHGSYRPLGEVVAAYRRHGEQMTQRRTEFWFSHDVVRHKTWASEENSAEQRRSVAAVWRIAQVRRALRCAARLASALVSGRWTDARRLGLGLAVLVVQAVRGRPPEARWSHVVWTGRGV